MDHLPQIAEPAILIPEIPYLSDPRFEYDGQGLLGFDERCGISFDDISFEDKDRSRSAFFQSWLFFGTLVEIFSNDNIPFLVQDFVRETEDGRSVLSTALLQDYLAAWVAVCATEDSDCLRKTRIEDQTALERMPNKVKSLYFIGGSTLRAVRKNAPNRRGSANGLGKSVLGFASDIKASLDEKKAFEEWVQNRNSITERRVLRYHHTLSSVSKILNHLGDAATCVMDEIWNSVLILCSTLQNTFLCLYRFVDWDLRSGINFEALALRSPFVLSETRWCPRERQVITELVDWNHCLIVLCSQLNRDRELHRHEHCSPRLCHANQVEQHSYHTKHVELGCDCPMIGVEKALRERVPDDEEDLQGQPVFSLKTPMVTYEYGQCRMFDITLPRVELTRIPKLNRALSPACVVISHVWAHGLGNPTENKLPECQVARLQALANELAEPSLHPVPFWIDTLLVPLWKNGRRKSLRSMEWIYKSAPLVLVLDKGLLNVRISSASKRMGPEEIALRIMCSDWASRLWTLQEGASQQRVVYRFADEFHTYGILRDQLRRALAFSNRQRMVPPDHHLCQILDAAPKFQLSSTGKRGLYTLDYYACKALNPCWPLISLFFKELHADYHYETGIRTDEGELTLSRVIRAIMSRTTSKIEDEAYVFSSLTSWRRTDSKGFPTVSARDPTDNFRALFRSARFWYVPSQMLFLNQPRYEQEGCRWIPTSFLSQESSRYSTLPNRWGKQSREVGLPTSYGVTARYPGLLLHITSEDSMPQRFCISWNQAIYVAYVHIAGSEVHPRDLPAMGLALVLPRRYENRPRKLVCVLVTVKDYRFNVTADRYDVHNMMLDQRPGQQGEPTASSAATDQKKGLGKRLKNKVGDKAYALYMANFDYWSSEEGRKKLKSDDDLEIYHRWRILARHEALVDLEAASSIDSATSRTLPLLTTEPIVDPRDEEGNNLWIIG